MNEFMLLIRTEGDHLSSLAPEKQQEHLQRIMKYIEDLMKNGKLKECSTPRDGISDNFRDEG